MFGPPASGKGSASGKICKDYNLVSISTGDLFRENIKNKTKLAQTANAYISRGCLVPDSVTIAMVKNRIKKRDCRNGVLFDGFPRTIPQCEELLKFAKIEVVINLKANEKILIERMAYRKVCESCASIFSKGQETCVKCGSKGIVRKDDSDIGAVKTRLQIYKEQTEPILGFLKSKGTLIVDINAEQTIEEVNSEIEAQLKEKLK